MLSVKIDEAKQLMIITLPLQTPKASASGKTLVVATTHGNQTTGIEVQGKQVRVGVNAYIDK